MQVINKPENYIKLFYQQGTDLALTFDLSSFTTTLTGASVRGQVRRTASSEAIVASFAGTVDVGEEEATVSLAKASIGDALLDVSDEARRTNTLLAYDIELEFADEAVVRLIWGELEVIPEVTK